jgi:hypothetical protein
MRLSGVKPLKQVFVIICIIVLAASCSGHTGAPEPGKATRTATSAQSYKGGVKAGRGMAVPGSQTLAQRLTKCQALAGKQMPAGDVWFEWVEGCTVGSYLGEPGGGIQSASAGP